MTGKRVFVTGFSAFPGMPDNPSERIVRSLGDRRWPPGIEFGGCTLTTSYGSVDYVASAFLSGFNPDLAVHIGVAESATRLRVERFGRNYQDTGLVDFDGIRPPASLIDPQGPDVRQTGYPVERLVDILRRRGVPVDLSDDAGGYVCNYLYYRSLQWGAEETGTDAVFIHIPYPADWRPTAGWQPVGPAHRLTYRAIKQATETTILALMRGL